MAEAFWRARPPLVRQRENFTCWAAALESWLRCCYPAGALDQESLLRAFAEWQNLDGSLKQDGLAAVARAFAMDSQTLSGAELTPEYLAGRLRMGPLYLVYRPVPGPVDGHIVVVHGVGPAAAECMDPAAGYSALPFDFLRSRIWAYVGWPARGVGATLPWRARPTRKRAGRSR